MKKLTIVFIAILLIAMTMFTVSASTNTVDTSAYLSCKDSIAEESIIFLDTVYPDLTSSEISESGRGAPGTLDFIMRCGGRNDKGLLKVYDGPTGKFLFSVNFPVVTDLGIPTMEQQEVIMKKARQLTVEELNLDE